MKRVRNVAAGAIVLGVFSIALAGINTDYPLGPLSLVIDDTGEAFFVNEGSSPFRIEGYIISSLGGNLVPGGWMQVSDQWLACMDPGVCLPGVTLWPDPDPGDVHTLDWMPINPTPQSISEVSLSGLIQFDPGAQISIGLIAPGGTQADLTFTYVDSTAQDVTSWEGRVVPEPASMMLMALGGLAIGRRKRRRTA